MFILRTRDIAIRLIAHYSMPFPFFLLFSSSALLPLPFPAFAFFLSLFSCPSLLFPLVHYLIPTGFTIFSFQLISSNIIHPVRRHQSPPPRQSRGKDPTQEWDTMAISLNVSNVVRGRGWSLPEAGKLDYRAFDG